MRGSAYRIETPRLVIRCYHPADAPLLSASVYESLDHLRPWMPWASHEPESLESRIQRLRRYRADFDSDRDYIYGIFDPQETTVLGGAGLHSRTDDEAREIGYWIHVDYLDRGLATESSAALVRVGFEVNGLSRIEIRCDPENVRSAAVPRKLGFIHEATLRRRAYTSDGRPRDTMIWSLFSDDYASSPAAHLDIAAFDVVGHRLI